MNKLIKVAPRQWFFVAERDISSREMSELARAYEQSIENLEERASLSVFSNTEVVDLSGQTLPEDVMGDETEVYNRAVLAGMRWKVSDELRFNNLTCSSHGYKHRLVPHYIVEQLDREAAR